MNLDNPFKVIVHDLLIAGMTYFGHQDGFLIVSVLVCMVTH